VGLKSSQAAFVVQNGLKVEEFFIGTMPQFICAQSQIFGVFGNLFIIK
jgi:hypothetical protein